MKGLIASWEALPRIPIASQTTSVSGLPRSDAAEAIPLTNALAFSVEDRPRITAADGYVLVVSPADADNAYLAMVRGAWTLVFPGEETRRRFIKNPVSFEGA